MYFVYFKTKALFVIFHTIKRQNKKSLKLNLAIDLFEAYIFILTKKDELSVTCLSKLFLYNNKKSLPKQYKLLFAKKTIKCSKNI